MIKIDDVKKMKTEIDKKIIELKKDIINFKMQSSVTSSEKPHVKSMLKKEIARILTFSKLLNK